MSRERSKKSLAHSLNAHTIEYGDKVRKSEIGKTLSLAGNAGFAETRRKRHFITHFVQCRKWAMK
jgi:hypothetical protein